MQASHKDIHFGGPDLKKNALRDVLLTSINNVPAGGEIAWMCYYLHEQSILDALISASKNRVQVTILIDKNPRSPEVNANSIALLKKHASPTLSLTTLQKKPLWEYLGIHWHPHFHSKYYYFSHPQPHVFVGSYNPTADIDQLGLETIKQIGDHSVSHNALIKISDPEMVDHLQTHYSSMQSSIKRYFARYLPHQNQTHSHGEWNIDFLPRWREHPILALMYKQDTNAKIKCAISHLKGPGIKKALKYALTHKTVEILLEPSKRRVSDDHIRFLEQNGANVYQPTLPEHCLMHNKFFLYENNQEKKIYLGSYNLSARSRLLNHEIIASITNEEIFRAFSLRWDIMANTKPEH